jgi:uncharacterized protein (DUF885 family)
MTTRGSQLLSKLSDKFWAWQCHEFPILAIRAGVDTPDDVLMRETPGDYKRRLKQVKALLSELDKVPFAKLNVQERATYALLERSLKGLVTAVKVKAYLRPSIFPLGPEFFLTYWADSTALATPADAKRYIARLATIGQALDGVCQCLAAGIEAGMRYPKLTVDRAVVNVRGQVAVPVEQSSFYRPLALAAGRSQTLAQLAEEGKKVIETTVYPAFRAYADCIEKELGAHSRPSLACTDDPDGEAFYRCQIEHFTSVDSSPEEIHQLGLSEVARLDKEMRAVAEQAGFKGDLKGFRRHLVTDKSQYAANAEELREQLEIIAKRVDLRIPEFFGHTPRTTYGVRSLPEAISAKMPPAYAQPNPADHTAAGVFWATSHPEKCPRYMHVPLVVHEAWPGHLMHLALIQEAEGLPAFRRYGALDYSMCLEGWAVYCEGLSEEMGFCDTPEKRYGRLEMEMWRAVRLVLDTGIHAKGWSRERALEFVAENMAMPMSTMEAEVDRYIAMPGQALAYQIGLLKIRELRRRCQEKLGEGFRIRDFHDAVMAAGAVSLPVLEDCVMAWLETQ